MVAERFNEALFTIEPTKEYYTIFYKGTFFETVDSYKEALVEIKKAVNGEGDF